MVAFRRFIVRDIDVSTGTSRGFRRMTACRCNTVLLLVALQLAMLRPVIASNGWLGLPALPRGTTSESSGEEREGGESERESETANGAEGRNVRRAANLLGLAHVPLRVNHEAIEPHPLTRALPNSPATGSEHENRFGLGTPIRI
jgi:hypothetical protein